MRAGFVARPGFRSWWRLELRWVRCGNSNGGVLFFATQLSDITREQGTIAEKTNWYTVSLETQNGCSFLFLLRLRLVRQLSANHGFTNRYSDKSGNQG